MRIEGKLAKWNDDRGYGFISPTHGGEEIFAHISAFPNDGLRPKLGETVSFEIEIDKSGKKRAIAISYRARAKVSRHNQERPRQRRKKPSLVSRLWPVFLLVLLVYGYREYSQRSSDSIKTQSTGQTLNERSVTFTSPQASNSDTKLSKAYENRTSNLQIEGAGRIIKLLSDDNDGSRHQRFIVRLTSGQTLLVAHNIDLAPRVDSLAEGDAIRFYGQYEWNEKGGVIHWTHHDPSGSHEAGWIEHNGRKYQ
jgi:cold shock CspA family protein